MPPRRQPLRMYGATRDDADLDWTWVDDQLRAAGTYWVVARTADAPPHPRPVWGVWSAEVLNLSVGSRVLSRELGHDGVATVHLSSDTDVVIVEGEHAGFTSDADVIASYDAKYDWEYDAGELGPLTVIRPRVVIAWRSAGWAGRDGFLQTGRWAF